MTDLDTRSLDEKIKHALKREGLDKTAPQEDANLSGLGFGMRIATEFMAGTAVGFGLGYALDTWCNTTPIFILLFTLLGFGAGLLNVYRFIMKIDDSMGLNREAYLTEAQQTARQNTDKNPQNHNP
jgi:ATP synthase protein I